MKLEKLAKNILKYMVCEYTKDNTHSFPVEIFKELFPNYTYDFISQALYLLEKEDLITVLICNDFSTHAMLLPEGITYCEENNSFKTLYKILKRILS